ncbi:MAG: cation-translocating P-type ATPase [Oscillospiraceae bacterium]|nr:cation-translocating P-type ATPase [Oscillospiraceae bacterium]
MNNSKSTVIGLSSEQAQKKLNSDGENRLAVSKAINPAGIFAGQFKDAMVIILLIATAVSVTMGEYLDAAAIITVVILNAILGFIQEYRAEKTLEALKKLSAPSALVYRDGSIVQLDAVKLVRGDVVRLEAGGRIPADCRLLNVMTLECDEALLTGESLPIAKRNGDSCFMGTTVVRGHALAEVIETGQATQMGLISGMLSDVGEERTPLQKKLGELGRIIGLICIAVCLVVSVLGIVRGYDVFEMMLTGISLAVAAIPEGLPAVVTISLALAVRRIYKQKALVNKLHSVETLGCANVICTDKTGTLTLNKMRVTKQWTINGGQGSGELLLKCGALCNNAIKQPDGTYLGDPTEIALMEAAVSGGIGIGGYKRVDEIPFDSSAAFMQVTVSGGQGNADWIKGSLEVILPKCGGLSASQLRNIHAASDSMTKNALRSLAFAYKKSGDAHFTFIGIQGMSDPLRPEIKKAVAKCKKAGITVVMLTGDHRNTAVEIARQAGISSSSKDGESADNCITGKQLSQMSDVQLAEAVKTARVFARVSPGDKLRIVRAFKANGDIVAMTGDGVNDAPAVKEAAIGVSMGIQGTDVTKEAAQLILLDDNFATLVSAVEQGRTVYNNIRKSMRYMLSSNIGEVLTMLLAMLLGMPVVLIPIQILLINLVTDGLPAIALSMEPATDNIMSLKPRKSNESIFAGGMFSSIIRRGLAIGVCTLAAFWLVLGSFDVTAARTAAMATLGLSQLIFVFECKDKGKGIFNADYRNNPHLILAVLASAAIIFLCLLSNVVSPVLQTVPLDKNSIIIVLAFAAGLPVVRGLLKLVK